MCDRIDRFNKVLEAAAERVSHWPEWMKSQELKDSERRVASLVSARVTPQPAAAK